MLGHDPIANSPVSSPLLEAYRAGKSITAIAKQFQCCRETIYKRLARLGIDTRNRFSNGYKKPGDDKKIIAAYRAGKTITAIAKEARLSRSNIRKRLIKNGITPPNPPRIAANHVLTKDLIADYLAGVKQAEMAKKYGMSALGIYYRLIRAGIQPNRKPRRPKRTRKPRRSKVNTSLVIELYRQGKTHHEIALEAGCSTSWVTKLLADLVAQGIVERQKKPEPKSGGYASKDGLVALIRTAQETNTLPPELVEIVYKIVDGLWYRYRHLRCVPLDDAKQEAILLVWANICRIVFDRGSVFCYLTTICHNYLKSQKRTLDNNRCESLYDVEGKLIY